MVEIYAKCPKCGAEVSAMRSMRWSMSVEADCKACGAHFTTAAFWEVK